MAVSPPVLMPLPPVTNPPQNPLDGHEQAVAEVARLAGEVGIRRVHMLAWRDFDDPEAGGSELHAHEIAKLWGNCEMRKIGKNYGLVQDVWYIPVGQNARAGVDRAADWKLPSCK